MTWLDRSLQRWRIAKAAPWIPPGSRVLDIGCSEGALFRQLGIREGLGIDPTLSSDAEVGAVKLIAGRFPERLPAAGEPFDVITILAVIEHVPPAELSGFLLACAQSLQLAGRVIVTVPSPRVDIILAILRRLRLIHGMSLDEHHGFAVEQLPRLFGEAGFALIHRRSFQLGLNHLFVFEKRLDDAMTSEPRQSQMEANEPAIQPSVPHRALLFGVFGLLLVGLAAFNWWNLNTDAVAYLQLARYWSEREIDSAISGYWGPMLPWLIAVGLNLGLAPLLAARLAMAASAILFLRGCQNVFRAFGMRGRLLLLGQWCAALASAVWSSQFITPDLLMAAWLCLGAARLTSSAQLSRLSSVAAGACLGLAYLAKPVAFPLGLLLILAKAGRAWRLGTRHRKALLLNLARALLGFMLVAAPWCTMLSLKYGKPVFSTGGPIAHAVVGPKDVDRYHPTFITIHRPESGRLTSWEDPTRMRYRYWSPWQSGSCAAHQLRLVAVNVGTVLLLLTSVCLLFPVALLHLVRFRKSDASDRSTRLPLWTRSLVPVALAGLIYVPVYVEIVDQRYFFFALPFLFVLAAGTLGLLSHAASPGTLNRAARWRTVALAASFVLPSLLLLGVMTAPRKNAAREASQLAEHLRAAGIQGPVVGSAGVSGRAGLFTAWFLDQPWYGDTRQPSATAYLESGAQIAVARRASALAAELDANPGFRNLDPVLFPAGAAPTNALLQAFEINPAPLNR